MISVLSHIIAFILTVVLVVILYPIACIFWIFGQVGKLSSIIFDWTKRLISYLWKDLSKQKIDTNN